MHREHARPTDRRGRRHHRPPRLRALLVPALLVAGLLTALVPSLAAPASAATTNVFRNPIGPPVSADPDVIYDGGSYYETLDQQDTRITIARAPSLGQLKSAPLQTVWTGGQAGSPCCNWWAPVLRHFGDRWYIYVTATDSNANGAGRRMYVLQSDGSDPLGSYHLQGRLYDPAADYWAIDGDAFVAPDGAMYFVWSGWPAADAGFPQNLYVSRMSDPWTLTGPRRLISQPDHDWERNGAAINEAPAPFVHDGRVFLTYSASGGNTASYVLGLLTLTSGNPYDGTWAKNDQPVMTSANGMCAPGSNSFFRSPDGSQLWIAYHARTDCSQVTWAGRRTSAQQVGFDGNGNPVFPVPVNYGQVLALPSGDPGTFGNEIANASFEEDHGTGVTPAAWQVWAGNCGCNQNAQFTEDGGGHSGTYRLGTWRGDQDYQVYTYQVVNGLVDGDYTLSGWVESSGGQGRVFLGIKDYGGGGETVADVPAASGWTYIQAQTVHVSGGQATVGFYTQGPANTWARLDDVQLVHG